ncbi:MAG: YCF48-related protein [Pseudomonadota bacterium]
MGRRARQWVRALACVIGGLPTALAASPGTTPALASPAASERLLLGASVSGSRVLAVGEQGHIILSDDSGESWMHAEVPVSLMLTSVTFSDTGTAWAVGHDGVVLTSDDAGVRWRTVLDGVEIARMQIQAAEAAIAALEATLDVMTDDDPALEDTGYALEDAQFDLEDAQEIAETGLTSPLLGIAFTTPDRGYAYGAYGVLVETRDAGQSWSLIADRLDNPDNLHLYDLAVMPSGTLLLVGEAGAVYRSSDDGETWDRLDLGYGGSLFGVLSLPDGATLAYGLRGRLFRSADAGERWQEIDSGARATLTGGTVLPDGRTALVGAGGTLLVGQPAGGALVPMKTPLTGALASVVALDSQTLMVVGFGGVAMVSLGAGTAAP